MKVLQINIVYGVGSTGKIVSDIHNRLLSSGHSSIVVFGQGNEVDDAKIIKVTSKYEAKIYTLYSRLSGYPYSGCILSTNKTLDIISEFKPDVVHLHAINSHFVNHYRLLDYLKTHNIFTVLTLHAEFMYTGKCGHAFDCEKWKTGCGKCPQKRITPKSWFFDRTASEWKRKQECYIGYNNLIIVPVSPWLSDRAKLSPFYLDKKFLTIGNGLDTSNIFRRVKYDDLIQKHGLKNEKILLHVTASFIDPFKGGKYILELANRFAAENIKIIILGYNGSDEIFPDNIIAIGNIRDQLELAKYYSLADLTILASKRETFSMICAESLSCGTPVVGFKAGAPEQISLEEYSEFVDYGEIDKLEQCIRKWIDKKQLVTAALAKEASEQYSTEKMFSQYLNLYKHYQEVNHIS